MIKAIIKYSPIPAGVFIAVSLFIIAIISVMFMSHAQAAGQNVAGKKFVTIHDRGLEKVILTRAGSVRDALKDAAVTLDSNDTVEPSLKTELIDNNYYVNIYRARPVVVVDGMVRQKIMTPYQTADKIAADAGIDLQDEDKTTLRPTEDILSEGAGLELSIDRAVPFTLVLYGKRTNMYTQANTVAAVLKDKKISVGQDDHVSMPFDAPVVAGMTIELWRNGKQMVNEDQVIAFASEKVYDTARPVGFREIQSPGEVGTRSVTFEIEMQSGRELARREVQSIVTKEPKKQIEVIGIKPGSGLSRSKGANMFTDSKGVVHRETYYDLAMNIVMNSCGGGDYSVRPDGAKVDKDGYILVAAHLGNYPRCSIVETSMGPGRVYDTGGFAARHPHGFDLATDWTNNNGR